MFVTGLVHNKNIIEAISDQFQIPCCYIHSNYYPDGEHVFHFDQPIKNKKLFLIFDLYPNIAQKCFELLCILNFAKQSNCEIVLFTPYFPYLRESKKTYLQVSSIDGFINHLNLLNVRKIITIDPHNTVFFKDQNFDILNINPTPYFVQYFLSQNQTTPVLVAPDAGAHQQILVLAQQNKLPYILCEKQKSIKNIHIIQSYLCDKLSPKDFLILDDICDTAETLILTQSLLNQFNPDSIHIWATHGLFTNADNTMNLLDTLPGVLYSSDTVPKQISNSKIKNFSIRDIVIDTLSKIKMDFN
ncbi:MAG: hypothetical protein C0432_01645 [Candidatus Puniceispirillum sp.]|nr:hypothetical protein [Candidatus Pelagibacter sp.]MBA4282980.1 hypothetical protein [Candidatus Puniceispirillum sp.]